MNTLGKKLKMLVVDRVLRRRVLVVLAALVIFRLLAAVPIPGVDPAKLAQFLASNQFFGILNIFSGGGLSNLSIIMLGVGPYITASIIMQLLTIMSPKLKRLYQEEGEIGRKKFTQYSRLLTIPLAALQGITFLSLLTRQGVLTPLTPVETVINLLVMVAGSMLLMWIGELVTEFGISNGVSLIIFAGIVSSLPKSISQLLFNYDPSQIPTFILLLAVTLIIIAAVVLVTEAERVVPVTYAKQVRGNTQTGGGTTYIPLRMNQAGVMPIIFALSILLIPQMVGNALLGASNPAVASIAAKLAAFQQSGWTYGILYFVLVFLFTYFYTAITFDPHAMSQNLQRGGAFVPGIRPGEATEKYFDNVVSRVTLVGALFLGIIAVLPLIIQGATGLTSIAIGGTAILIVVSVVLDIIKKIDSQLSMREY
jgi:preprotein translocase subunit SecY